MVEPAKVVVARVLHDAFVEIVEFHNHRDEKMIKEKCDSRNTCILFKVSEYTQS